MSGEKTLNALRMGVIPKGDLHTFMVGKEKEKEELSSFLESIATGGSQVRFLRGAYGTGKTFLLKYLSETAMSQNYIVATIPIHSGFGFSKFEAIYSNIMSNLSSRFDEGGGSSFETIFERWIMELRGKGDMGSATQDIYKAIQSVKDYNSSFANVLLVYIRAKISHDYELAGAAAAWIKGDRNLPYQLKRQLQVKGSVDRDNALDIFRGFVQLIHEIGYRGIIITFDEGEMIMQQRVDIRMKAYGNIRQLMDYSGMGELDHCGFVFAGTPALYEDVDKGIPSYQALNQRIGQLIQGNRDVSNHRQPLIQIHPFTKDDFRELTEKVMALHEETYHFEAVLPGEQLVNLVMLECVKQVGREGVSVRVYLKKLLELLDMMKDNPELPIFKAMGSKR